MNGRTLQAVGKDSQRHYIAEENYTYVHDFDVIL